MDNKHLISLGARLKDARLQKNDTQQMFAARIGVSIPTLKKMEDGNPGVQIRHWITALRMLDRETDLDYVLAPAEDLFAKYEQMNTTKRQRAARRKKS